MSEHPFLDPAFQPPWSRFSPDRVQPDIEAALERAQKRLDAITALEDDSLTYANTLRALEEATEELERAWGYVAHLDSVSNTPELRKAYNAVLPKVSDFFTRIPLNAALWRVLKAYANTEEGKALTGVRGRFLQEVLDDFRENGADLPEEAKDDLGAINAELAAATQKFSENVLDATNAWELLIDDEARLAGLPPSAREAALESARLKGSGTDEEPVWRFTLQAPSFFPVLQYAEDDELRREVYEALTSLATREPHDNTGLVRDILNLRQRKAELLGHKDFADHILQRRMARSGGNALAFVENLHERVRPTFERENAALEAFVAEKTGGEPEPLEPWQIAYWAERLRRERHAFDEEELRPYLPVNGVISGLFELVERVFNISIQARPTVWVDPEDPPAPSTLPPWARPVEVWHKDVRFYEVKDADGTPLGSFYADWHPRESKRGGAWMNTLRTGKPNGEGLEPHLGLMCGNLTPPVGGKPALLTLDEVETIFHEFGHLLHHLLGRVEVPSLNGIHVRYDFVELPSQMMENWCWERESLDLFARHHETGEPVPEELFQKMKAARTFREAVATMRQLTFGKLDLELHINLARDRDADLEAELTRRLEPYRVPTKTTPPTGICRFLHLFSDPTGYAAGYYSYKWAEVLDADAFTRFQREGILNSDTGRDFREKILARGNSEPPEDLFRAFMGRDPDETALLKRAGLA